MIKIYFTSLFIVFFSFGFSQSYPYLNASTGNENEFPVDKDTNIYMFHENRLVKTDKNFNAIWAYTYSGISFTNLLLSKTGSMYFLAGPPATGPGIIPKNYFGKLNSDGSIGWIKTITASSSTLACTNFILDRNNNLVFTSGTSLLKTDTNGNAIKFKVFGPGTGMTCLQGLSIITDSLGIYKLIGEGNLAVSSFGVMLYSYNDNTDAFIGSQAFGTGYPPYYGLKWKLVKSKLNDNFYLRVNLQCSPYDMCLVQKFTTHGQIKWVRQLGTYNGGTYQIGYHVEDAENGEVLYSLDSYGSNINFKSSVNKIDSMGTSINSGMTMLNNYNLTWCCSFMNLPKHAGRVIHGNNYYFDVYGYYFPANPLTIQKFNSSMTYSCSTTTSYSAGSGVLGTYSFVTSTPTVQSVTGYTISNVTSSVSAVTFSIDPGFCTILSSKDINDEESEFEFYPNPVSDKLYLKEVANLIEVFDVNGKKVRSISNTSGADVGDLAQGVYFIRIKSDKGEFNKKFIKN